MLQRFTESCVIVIATLCFSFAIYIILFLIDGFSFIGILLFRGAVASFIAAVAAACIVPPLLKRFSDSQPGLLADLTVCSLGIAAFSILMLFHLAMPVSIDRSISIFMLSDIAEAPNGLARQQIKDRFITTYIDAYDAFGKRIAEQKAIGNIYEENERYFATGRGRWIVLVSRLIARGLHIDTRFVCPWERGVPSEPSRVFRTFCKPRSRQG